MTAAIVLAIFYVILSAGAFTISCRSFREKGFLFHNAYLWASKQERKTMNKKPYYRQSAIVFLLLGIILLLMAIEVFFDLVWIFFIALAVGIAAIVYAVVSDARLGRKRR